MQLKQALLNAIQQLEANDVGSPRLNAETLLMFALGCDRAHLYGHPERELDASEIERFSHLVAERAAGKPAQYISGHQEFWGLDFLVTPAVLIPRPETEHMIETVLALVKQGGSEPALEIVDIGTGSGCIALALAKELPAAKFHACDISPEALEIAEANAARLGLADWVHFLQSDLFEKFGAEQKFDYIICNPPYVSELEPEKVQRQVREFEPKVAVFSGATGLEIYHRLIPQARERLKPGGWLVMEIGYSIEAPVRAQLTGWAEVRTHNDLQGISRVVAAKLN